MHIKEAMHNKEAKRSLGMHNKEVTKFMARRWHYKKVTKFIKSAQQAPRKQHKVRKQ
jgi:hypothetical protein